MSLKDIFTFRKKNTTINTNELNSEETIHQTDSNFDINLESVKKTTPVFITGVGRSGTHFFARLFQQLSTISAYHLDDINNSTADSFYMYARYYGLPIDTTDFFSIRNTLICKALNSSTTYVESNPYLALHTSDLYQYYPNSHIIIVNRDPRKVVLSNLNKGWYKDYNPHFSEWGSVPGYQYSIKQPNHFFGRIFPNQKEEFKEWLSLTRVGKVAWMYKTIQNHIRTSLVEKSPERVRFIDIDTFTYDRFLEICEWLSINKSIHYDEFSTLKSKKPGKTRDKKITTWGDKEEFEFRSQTDQIIEI